MLRASVAILASALLLGIYARGGFAVSLGFVALVPWLASVATLPSWRAALASGIAMAMLFALAVFAWFGDAVAAYTGIGTAGGIALVVLAAPLMQPQVVAAALAARWAAGRLGPVLRAVVVAAAWVACEWACPKLLGDSLGHGLQPAAWWRQAADLGGVPVLTFVLVLCNHWLADAWRHRRDASRGWRLPLACALALPVLLAGYGAWRSAQLRALPVEDTLRVAMVQANIVDYERLRRERGAYAVVREVLDTHVGMSRAALDAGGVDALLWSETVYPTTFGKPRSEAGAELDAEIAAFARGSGVPLVFGTYDRDAVGEYNAAAVLDPRDGLLGFYRKTHPFPLTEHVPGWLDGPRLRRLLPWAGTWLPGDGARSFPLRLPGGREVPVAPMICLDDVHPALAREAARQGARALLGLSNDAWFSAHPQGARLHLAVAAFRSVETRLPQLRVTTNGISAVVDADGGIRDATAMGTRALLVGEVAVRTPPLTRAVAWGGWFGPFALGLLLLVVAMRQWPQRSTTHAGQAGLEAAAMSWPLATTWLSPPWRWAGVLLQGVAGATLAAFAGLWLFGDASVLKPMLQLRLFVALVALPTAAWWLLRRAHAARVALRDDVLHVQGGGRSLRLPVAALDVRPLRLPFPGTGLRVRGEGGDAVLLLRDPVDVLHALGRSVELPRGCAAYLAARGRHRGPRWDRAWLRTLLFPLLPAMFAFRLHQHIAYGGTFGEWQTFGATAWLTGAALWWAGWIVGLAVFAAVLRAVVEAACLAIAWGMPARAATARHVFEAGARAVYYLGVPAWLVLRVLA